MRKYCIGLLGALTIATASAVEPGDKAPGFTLQNTKGEQVSLSDFKGKLVVLEWLNYDCPFVKKHYQSGNMPALQEKYTGKDVVWLAVNSNAEGKQGYLPAAELGERSKKEGSKATAVLLDTSGTVGKSYGAKTTPHMFVISKDGEIAYAGGIDDKKSTQSASLEGATNYVANALDALIAGKEVETPKAAPYGCGVKY
ncbi:thioredoxin family protein [Haloferula chungangensis]|uniref:Thioredoxin family protein n=1 Tax=Haloferula chungangensis TaxID=1048331 RepID=A0ABW2L9G5_9BACT